MNQTYKNIKPSFTALITAILLTFIFPILLLSKAISVTPDASLAHILLFFSVPISIFTMLYQLIFFRFKLNQLKTIRNSEEKKLKIYKIFAIRLKMTFIAIITNFIFLALTNFDLFLVINIVLVLWMINIFPFSDKIKRLLEENSKN